MAWKNLFKKPVGVIGAGSFGTAVANILAEKSDVLLYGRSAEKIEEAAKSRKISGHQLGERITPTSDLELVAKECDIIFPIVPSANFRELMGALSPFLKPYHILIHGTKGLDVHIRDGVKINSTNPLSREEVKTMSEVITEESSVVRVGCMAGPNLAREIADKKPAATVIASHFDEVIDVGQRLLRNDRFLIYGSNDLIGIELCGVLKNIIAIGAGAIDGLGLGENAKSLLISRGIVEMVHIGQALGGNAQAFLGLAGIGDLVATCSSTLSRNYTVGNRLAKGDTIEEISSSMEETAEGVKTVDIINELSKTYSVRCPITESLYKVIHHEMTMEDAHTFLMKFPFRAEIEFLQSGK